MKKGLLRLVFFILLSVGFGWQDLSGQTMVNIPVLDPGDSICIVYDVEIDSPFPVGVGQVLCQDTVTVMNPMAMVPTSDPDSLPTMFAPTGTLICNPLAGTIAGNDTTLCTGDSMSIVISGNQTAPEYTQVFLIVDQSTLDIVSIQTDTNLNFSTADTFKVYSFNYLTASVSDTTGLMNIADIVCDTMGTCCDTSMAMFTVIVLDLDPGMIGTDQTICSGDVPAPLAETMASSGTGRTYQWQMSTTDCSSGFAHIGGATSVGYSPPALTQTTYYRRIVSVSANMISCSDTTNCVTITVNDVDPGTIAADQTICSGDVPATLTDMADPASGSGPLTYQWQSSTDGCMGTFANIGGATMSSYSPPALTDTMYYRRVVTSTLNALPCSDTTNCVTILINDITPGVIDADQTICNGDDPAAFTESVLAVASGTLTYRWQRSTTGCMGVFADIGGATSATYDPPALTMTTSYRRIDISTLNAVVCQDTTNCLTITVNDVTPGAIGVDDTVCYNTVPPTIIETMAATGSNPPTYQWQQSTTGCAGTFSDIGGATMTTYSPPALLTTTSYRRIATSTLNAFDCSDTSNCVTISVQRIQIDSVVQHCTGPMNYDLNVCFQVATPGPSGMFEVTVNGLVLGPFLYSSLNMNGCIQLSNAAFDPTNQETFDVSVADVDLTNGMQCGDTVSFTEQLCFVCPTIGAIVTPPQLCEVALFDLSATGLMDMAMAQNSETDFGIDFVFWPGGPPPDPYVGGTSLGTVPFASLTNGGTVAPLNGISTMVLGPPGMYTICAILTPTPTIDMTCRPFQSTTLELVANASLNCRDVNLAVAADGSVQFMMSELIMASSCSELLNLTVMNDWGAVIYRETGLARADVVVIPNVCPSLGKTLKAWISYDSGRSCLSEITLKQSNGPIFGPGSAKDVYCFDPLVESGHIGGQAPIASIPCGGTVEGSFVADWTIPYDCDIAGQNYLQNDTVKVILREYEAFDKEGRRSVVYDTLTVFNLPFLAAGFSGENAYCAEVDTTYCGVIGKGPFFVIPERCDPGVPVGTIDFDNDLSFCDTIYFLKYDDSTRTYVANPLMGKCGLNIHLDQWQFGGGSCEAVTKYVLEVKQNCYGAEQGSICNIGSLTDNAFEYVGGFPNFGFPNYLTCAFWVTDLDTIPPKVACKAKADPSVTRITTSAHECAAYTYIPEVWIADDWSGIKQVKARIEGIGTYLMSYNEESGCYASHQQVKLSKNEDGYAIIYEAYDSCHNVATDTCRVYVKDRIRPVVVSDKGATVSLSDKKVWVDAATFDEGSWDNCGINMLLARRTDWYEACIDLCDDIDTCYISEHHDTIWQAQLESDKHVDEVEAHYAKTLQWLWEDDQACSELLYNAWQYDLLKYATLACKEGHYGNTDDLHKLLKGALLDPDSASEALVSKFKCLNGLDGIVPGDLIFVGTDDGEADAGNNQSGDGTSDNDFYAVNVETGAATKIPAISRKSVRALAADEQYNRLLYTGSIPGPRNDGSVLYEWSIDGKSGVRKLGELRYNGYLVDAQGLGILNGKLYAYVDDVWEAPTNTTGIFEIDLRTLKLTLVVNTTGGMYTEITALDGDEETGKLYGADDGDDDIIEIDVETGTITKLGDYPGGQGNLEGMGIGGGKLYLTDDDGDDDIFVFDIESRSFETGVKNPITSGDDEAGIAALFERSICGYSKSQMAAKVDIWSQIGGGWSDAVPFDCNDACGPVTVEILVMDYWCNWSMAWTKVWVEDKTPVEVVKDVVDEEHITCKTYKDDRYAYPNAIHPVSLEYIVGQAKAGEQDAYDALDEIFGGYCKAWRDPYGNYVDETGTELECDITFYDSICQCTSYYEQVRVFDEHLGYLWIDSLITKCDYDQDTIDFQKGVVVVNCAENVYCEQDVWCEIDHCGQGYLFRKFKIWQGCPDEFYDAHGVADSLRHTVDTIYRHQRIWIGNECELNKYMFDVPYDTEVVTCDIEYGPDGNVVGAAGPENTGYATYKFDDDCRIVGIAHSDKVFKIVGGEAACYKILRTWYFADWCGYGEPLDGQWWRNRELVTDTCVQKIIVRDTTPPTCMIVGPVEDDGAIEVGACYFDLDASVVGMDACGVIKYYWDLKDVKDGDDPTIVDSGYGELSGDTTEGFEISSPDLPHGSYKLVVTIQDDCANESYCEYLFDVVSVKKPSPVCISSLTARLTPWDSDQDGTPDSAHAIVWAEEFNSSSSEACTDTALEYRVELIDGIDDDTWEEDTSYIEVFCDDFGSHMARLWVISWPSGTVDFCDVVLIVQSDFSGCTNTVSGEPGPVRQVNDMHDVVRPTHHKSSDGAVEPIVPGGRPLRHINGGEAFALYQNVPNPFRVETTISFYLPQATAATMTVYDVTGKVLRVVQGDYAKGLSSVTIRHQELNATGVLYYQLDTEKYTATRKMVVLR